MKFGVFIKQTAFAFLCMTSGLSLAIENKPEVTVDGLHLARETGYSLVYVLPDIDLAQYNKVYVDDAYIAFKKHWQEKQNKPGSRKISTDDMVKIKTELSSLFREIFSLTLEENGYQLVTEPAQDVLQIKPVIINLEIVTPAIPTDTGEYTYAESAGEISLYLEIYDSLSGDIIAKAIDRKKDRQPGYIQWQNRISNRAAAHRILQVWANILIKGLDETRAVNQPGQQANTGKAMVKPRIANRTNQL
jgi:hypothetical protein